MTNEQFFAAAIATAGRHGYNHSVFAGVTHRRHVLRSGECLMAVSYHISVFSKAGANSDDEIFLAEDTTPEGALAALDGRLPVLGSQP